MNEKPFDSSVPIDETDVIGHTRFVFLDENVGETVSPYMSQPLDMESDYIGGRKIHRKRKWNVVYLWRK